MDKNAAKLILLFSLLSIVLIAPNLSPQMSSIEYPTEWQNEASRLAEALSVPAIAVFSVISILMIHTILRKRHS